MHFGVVSSEYDEDFYIVMQQDVRGFVRNKVNHK